MKVGYREYSDYLENEHFICWVISPTDKSDSFWLKFIEEHPQQKSNIERARQIIKSTAWNKSDFTDKEISEMYDEIIEQYNASKESVPNRRLLSTSWYVAAVAVLIISLLSIGVFKYLETPVETFEMISLNELIDSQKLYDKDHVVLEIAGEKYYFKDEVDIKFNGDEITINSKIKTRDKSIALPSHESTGLMYVPHTKRSSITLADNSKIWVNSGTTIAFPIHSKDITRKVCIEGEIYASVTKDERKPFIVETPNMEVKVLGTEFNIYAYKEEANSSVVLVNGSVTVSKKEDFNDYLLKPNERLEYAEDGFIKTEVDVSNYTSWRNGVLQFSGESLLNISAKLSQYYGIDIKCNDAIKNKQMSGKLVLFQDVNTVLNSLSDIFSVTYTVSEEGITISQ